MREKADETRQKCKCLPRIIYIRWEWMFVVRMFIKIVVEITKFEHWTQTICLKFSGDDDGIKRNEIIETKTLILTYICIRATDLSDNECSDIQSTHGVQYSVYTLYTLVYEQILLTNSHISH